MRNVQRGNAHEVRSLLEPAAREREEGDRERPLRLHLDFPIPYSPFPIPHSAIPPLAPASHPFLSRTLTRPPSKPHPLPPIRAVGPGAERYEEE